MWNWACLKNTQFQELPHFSYGKNSIGNLVSSAIPQEPFQNGAILYCRDAPIVSRSDMNPLSSFSLRPIFSTGSSMSLPVSTAPWPTSLSNLCIGFGSVAPQSSNYLALRRHPGLWCLQLLPNRSLQHFLCKILARLVISAPLWTHFQTFLRRLTRNLIFSVEESFTNHDGMSFLRRTLRVSSCHVTIWRSRSNNGSLLVIRYVKIP